MAIYFTSVKTYNRILEIWGLRFESSVISNGSKTVEIQFKQGQSFESSVIPNGSKTAFLRDNAIILFESSVIPNGSKTSNVSERE